MLLGDDMLDEDEDNGEEMADEDDSNLLNESADEDQDPGSYKFEQNFL